MRRLFALVLALLALLLLSRLLWAGVTWAGTTRCTTYEEKTLGRRHTVCDDGTRAVSTYNRALEQWDTTVTSPPTVTPSQRAPRGKEHRR
jgi:hypothetical protein